MDKEQDLLEELRMRAAALVEAKEKADDTDDEEDMDDEDGEDEIEDGAEDDKKKKVDELSKKTLGDYVNKATSGLKGTASQGFMAGANQGKNDKVSDKAYGTAVKRIGGIRNAVSRLTKESEEVDELSKKTLGDYVNKATSGLKGTASQGFMSGANQGKNDKVSDKAYGTAVKRIGGIRNAVSRLTKESEEVSELSEYTLEEIQEFMESEDFSTLDELSKKTLGAYVNKATSGLKGAASQGFMAGANQGKNDKVSDKAYGTAVKRIGGIRNAVSRLTKESEEVDMSIEQLFEGQDLSEEFKIKITALFEATVAQKVSAIEESYAAAMEEFTAEVSEQALSESEEVVEGLVERVDGYLDYMVEQWIENNEIALERGIKADLFESFMHGMKGLFEEHMINVPEDEIEVLESQAAEIEELEDTVDSVFAENVELKQVLKEIVKQNQIMEAAEGLSEVEMERFVELAEELAYDNEEVFGKKLDVIREQFFSQSDDSKQLVESMTQMTTNEPLVEEVQMPKRAMSESVDPTIAALAARISRNTY